MPSWVVTSPGPIVETRWTRRSDCLRPPAVATVTSILVAVVGRSSYSAAAEAWLKAAPGPHARTAAI